MLQTPEIPLSKYQIGEVILLDKPYRWTSFNLVHKIKIHLQKKYDLKKLKVGHAGTLDPLATGLVIVCTGKKTKEIDSYQAQEKEYIAEFFLGATTPSFDLETEPENFKSTENLTDFEIKTVAERFLGKQKQLPPIFSAKRIDGQRAYTAARSGREITMKEHDVEIFEMEILKIEMPVIEIRISCSKGTYIRSIAKDFGEKLGCGAYMKNLRRTKIGNFSVNDAISLDNLQEML